jgi:hypothetical protein
MRSANSYQDIETPEDLEAKREVESIFQEMVDDYENQIGYKPDSYTMRKMREKAKAVFSEGGEE